MKTDSSMRPYQADKDIFWKGFEYFQGWILLSLFHVPEIHSKSTCLLIFLEKTKWELLAHGSLDHSFRLFWRWMQHLLFLPLSKISTSLHDSCLPQIVLIACFVISMALPLKMWKYLWTSWLYLVLNQKPCTIKSPLKLLYYPSTKKWKRGDYDQILGISSKYLQCGKMFCILALATRLIRAELRLV